VSHVEWTSRFSVGVPDLDEQHRQLIALYNRVDEALRAGQAHRRMHVFLEELLKYADFHFASEETLMERAGYAELEAHRAEHEQFRRRILRLKNTYDAGQARVSRPLAEFLSYWLENHITGTDSRYRLPLRGMSLAEEPVPVG
jgi:hemerythrin